MKKIQQLIKISVPNLVNVCVDRSSGGEISGRLYHCYQKEPVAFSNLIQLLRIMEELFDEIQYPQSATRNRRFFISEEHSQESRQKITEQSDVIQWTGQKATFVITVQFRQNSTWQGEMFWLEKEEKQSFSSTLDLIKIMDADLSLTGMGEVSLLTADDYVINR